MMVKCMRVRSLVLAVCLVALVGCASKPKNIILFIGDGMGSAHVEAARLYNGKALSFESLPHRGRLSTHSANADVTDSAAAASALATGHKVFNGVVSMVVSTHNEPSELPTLLEYYKARGKSTGLVSSTNITGATPGAFGAHEFSRNNYPQIAEDYLRRSRPNVLLGGGETGITTSAATAAGYTVVTDRAGLLAIDTETADRISGQFGDGALPYESDGLGDLPHLSEMTVAALHILDNDPDGFFLMVEGAKIDHGAHENKIERTVLETVEFARAVQKALDWAEGRTDTVIIVTADHETGGLKVLADGGAGVFPKVTWGTTGHTATSVPVYARGPNTRRFDGKTISNTDVYSIVTGEKPEPLSRFTMVLMSGEVLLDLPEQWLFRKDPTNIGERQQWFAATADVKAFTPISISTNWEAQWVGDYDGLAWYVTDLVIPPTDAKRVWLRFGAVDELAKVWMNGQYIGASVGEDGYLWDKPILFEITGKYTPGDTIRLVVQVHDSMAAGGIWKPVKVIVTDE